MTSSTLFTGFSSCQLLPAGPGATLSVVWLRGEHDIANKDDLAATLAEAIALDEPAVVIDMSGVQFISAATVGVIVAARQLLRRQSRSLVLRAPSDCVLRIFEVCGLNEFLDQDSYSDANGGAKEAEALGSWVKVPVFNRVGWRHDSPMPESGVFAQLPVPVCLPIGRGS